MVLKDHDILLVKGLIKGHMASFNAVYNKYHNAVYANILKYVQSKEPAEDILQEVFLSLWENRQNLHENGSVGGWLFVVSHNKSLAFLRKALTEKKAFSALLQVETEEEGLDEELSRLQADVLNEAINALPASKREIFRLCKLQGKTYNEAARLLDISPAAVKENLKSAYKLIRLHVSAHYSPVLAFSLLSLKLLAG